MMAMCVFSYADQPRLAVVDFKIVSNAVVLGPGFEGISWNTDRTQAFCASLGTLLASTQKFQVIERAQLAKVLTERQFTDLTSGVAFGTGEFGGAEYCVVGEITMLSVKRTETPIPYSNSVRVQHFGDMGLNIRLISVQSGKVLVAKKVLSNLVRESVTSPDTFLEELQSDITKKAGNIIIQGAYPVKISTVSGDIIFLNRGADADFQIGSRLTVYSVGAEVIDPDTKKKLGNTETPVAEIEITEMQDKMSKARAFSLPSAPLIPGMICRVSQYEPPKTEKPRTPGSSDAPVKW
jgi:hypothetical protein